jgi:hypothetical protein
MAVGLRGLRPLCAIAALAGVTACSGASYISPPSYNRYSSSDFAFAGANRDLQVVIRGNPSTLSDPAFAQAAVDAMQGKKPGVQTHFTLNPQPDRPDYRVVLLFDSTSAASERAICTGRAPIAAQIPQGQPIQVQAAFCWRDEALSSLSAGGPLLAADPRPQLASFMGAIIPVLLPVENPRISRASDDSRR